MKNTKVKMDIAFDHHIPSLVVKIPEYNEGYKGILERGAKIRCITEVTPENIQYCKELLNLVTELRHLDGLKEGIAINESEYMATTLLKNDPPLTQVIYSNKDEVVAQGQHIFDTFWKNSVPASRKIKELEYGITTIKTKVLESKEEVNDTILKIVSESKYLDICTTIEGMKFGQKNYNNVKSKILKDYKEGIHSGIRWITSINNKNDINFVKLLSKEGIKVRHISEIPFINFVVSNKYFALTIEKMADGEMISNLLFSNDPLYLEHFSSIFDNMWKMSVEATNRIKEIEDTSFFSAKVVSNPDQSVILINELYDSAHNEILIILPSVNAFARMIKLGSLEKFNDLSYRGVSVKILLINNNEIEPLKDIKSKYSRVEFRTLQFDFLLLNRITIIDRIKTIVIKITDDTQSETVDAIGLTTIIEDESTACSYTAIFDTLWKQTEEYEKLKKITEQLQSNVKLQKEFFDIIAHELRNPIQPIIGITEYVKDELKDQKQIELLDSVIASGQKLNILTRNILDISKIENNPLIIKKEKFHLNKSILSVIKVFENLLLKRKNNIKLYFDDAGQVWSIMGDKTRIEQVISNLIYNSIKSISRKGDESREGKISIAILKKMENSIQPDDSEGFIKIVIEDNGQGINPDMMPFLFTKFSKSLDGNGLGLYISKKIVEAHGGKIWAENNKDESGAKFCFILPINDNPSTSIH